MLLWKEDGFGVRTSSSVHVTLHGPDGLDLGLLSSKKDDVRASPEIMAFTP